MSEVTLRSNQITKVDSILNDTLIVNFEKATVGSEYKLIFTTDSTSSVSINFLANIKWMDNSDLVLSNDRIYEFDFILYHGIVLGSYVSYDNRYAVNSKYEGCTASNTDKLINTDSKYISVITAEEGYTLEGATVSIIMNGKEISDVVYSDGIITIDKVTSDLSITISSKLKEVTTNPEDNNEEVEESTEESTTPSQNTNSDDSKEV